MTRSLFRLSTLASLAWAVAGTSSPAAAQQTDIQRLALGHYLDIESVSNPQISPDASQIV